MIPLPAMIKSNERVASTFPDGLVAVFVGGTSGVGEYTLLKLAKYASKPRVYIVGRSQESADRIIKECKLLNPDGKFQFIKSDISLLVNVDDVCRQIMRKETAINILFQSQGSMAFKSKTSEGLPFVIALVMHSRMRFIANLLPLIQKADTFRRVVSVLVGTCEGAIDLTNIDGDGFFVTKWRNQMASCQSLLLEEIAQRAPDVSFVHTLPGIVDSGITRKAEGAALKAVIAVFSVFNTFLETPPDECGEFHLMAATSAMFPPGTASTAIAGVSLVGKLGVARSINGKTGSGVYSINEKGESASPKAEKVLEKYRQDGTAEKIVKHVEEVAKKLIGTIVLSL